MIKNNDKDVRHCSSQKDAFKKKMWGTINREGSNNPQRGFNQAYLFKASFCESNGAFIVCIS